MEFINIITQSFRLYLNDDDALSYLKEKASLSQLLIIYNIILLFFLVLISFKDFSSQNYLLHLLILFGRIILMNLSFLTMTFFFRLGFKMLGSEVNFKIFYKVALGLVIISEFVYFFSAFILVLFQNYFKNYAVLTLWFLIKIILGIWFLYANLNIYAKLTKTSIGQVIVVTFLLILFMAIIISLLSTLLLLINIPTLL